MASKKNSPSPQPHNRYSARAADLKILGYVEAATEAEALKKARKRYDATSVELSDAADRNGEAVATQQPAPAKKKGRAAKAKVPPPAATEAPTKEGLAAPGQVKAKKRSARGRGQGTAAKLSAVDAAARVLEEAGRSMTSAEMIATMAEKGYWKSPGGLTPEATLYAAILRELTRKGDASRFQKTGRGQFARTATNV